MLIQLREQLHDEPGQLGRLESLAYRAWAADHARPAVSLATWLATRTAGRWFSERVDEAPAGAIARLDRKARLPAPAATFPRLVASARQRLTSPLRVQSASGCLYQPDAPASESEFTSPTRKF